MRPRNCRPPAVALALLSLGAAAGAAARPASESPRVLPPSAEALYDRSLSADDRFSYRGRQVTTYWRSGYTVATLVSHRAPGLDRLDYLAPARQMGRKFISNGREDWEYDPIRRVLLHQLLPPNADAVADAAAAYSLLQTNYLVTVEPQKQTWANRKVFVLSIRRRGSQTLARKLWIDAATGLVLKREGYREDGRLVLVVTFTGINFRPGLTRAAFDPTRLARRSAVVQLPVAAERTLPVDAVPGRLAGPWLTPAALAGYRLVGAAVADGPRPRLHLRYSDGLNLVSLFEQRRVQTRQPTRVPRARPVQVGALLGHVVRRASLTALNWDAGAFNLTLMGEVSQATLQRLALTVDGRHP